MPKRFRNLTPAQEQVFEQIAINQDGGHHRTTLKKLLALGLIEKHQEYWKQPGESLAVLITRYIVPLAIHIEWCEWCAENCAENDDENKEQTR